MKDIGKPTKLVWLNRGGVTGVYQFKLIMGLADEFPGEEIIALEVGCAYGGAVEAMAKILYGKGKVYGFDTFEGHPKDLSANENSPEATCMDYWYDERIFGRSSLDYDYQCKVLKEEGLDNAFLVKGRVNRDSFNEIKKAHFVMLDLDLVKSTQNAYEGIKDKIVKGGYLFLHDALPEDHLPLLHDYIYKEVIPDGRWEVFLEDPTAVLTVLKRK